MRRAVVYLRVSTLDQTTANQERELREMARGVKLARYAYECRKGRTPPAMRGATFVSSDDGITLMLYRAEELNGHD
jgi:DNA invertase Pin-like site-specific DNA recombinase